MNLLRTIMSTAATSPTSTKKPKRKAKASTSLTIAISAMMIAAIAVHPFPAKAQSPTNLYGNAYTPAFLPQFNWAFTGDLVCQIWMTDGINWWYQMGDGNYMFLDIPSDRTYYLFAQSANWPYPVSGWYRVYVPEGSIFWNWTIGPDLVCQY